jgi:hypothetical protein
MTLAHGQLTPRYLVAAVWLKIWLTATSLNSKSQIPKTRSTKALIMEKSAWAGADLNIFRRQNDVVQPLS